MEAHYFCDVCDTYFDSEKNPTTADALTIPMAAHSYTADVELEGSTYTITGSCSTCETINVTATLTLEKGEEGATGTAPETLDVTFDGTSFTVTLPACPYEYEGHEFTGWLNGTETVGATLSLDADEKVTLTAQWALVTTVSSEAELRAALNQADIDVITVAQSFEIAAPITISRAVTIDLNDKGLTFTGDGTQLTIQGTESENIKVTLRSGSITFTTTAYVTSTCIAINLANVTIDDVKITTGTSAIFPAVATLTVRNSTITAFTYGIGTNASVEVEQDGTTKEVFGPVNLTIENSIVKTTDKDSTAVLFNVEGSLSIIDSDLEGGRQGLILRKGIGTVTGGSITSRWEYANKDQYIPAEGAQAAWRTGNEVPMAAIVIGDTGKNYNGDAILTISETEVKLGNTDATRYIYLWADTTDSTAAKLVYACDDAYMPDLAEAGKIVCGNPEAEVTVTHAALTHYDAKEATCTEAGNVEYSYCETCDTYLDAEGDVITQEEIEIRATGHGLGDLYIATEGAHIGYLVADCSKCNKQIAIGKPKNELEVSFIDGKTGYSIGDDISPENFNVVMTFEILIDVADGLVAGTEQKVDLTDESVPVNIRQYLESNLDALTAASWANDLEATFTFAVGGTTVAEGAITFDVVPSSSQLGIGDATVLYNKAGDATNHQVDSYENIQYLGNVDETGVSVSFWLSKVITNDWLAFINSCGVCIGLPNLDPWNALADIPEAAQFREMNKTPAPENLCGEAVYSMFLRNESFVTITITAEGSVQFYKNGVEVIVYNSTDEMSDDTTAVGDFATTLLSLMATYGFVFAGADGVAAENLFITEALSDSAVAALYNWYAPKYVPEEDAALRQTVATTLGEDVTIYTADAGAASATIYSAGTFTNLSETGLTIMFYIPEGGSMSGGSANDWQPVITSNGYIVGNGCLDAWSATGTLTGWSKTEMTAASGEGVVWDEFAHGGCTITVTITTTDGVLMYKDGNLVFDHDAGQNGTAGTGTVKDFVDCLFAALESSGGRIAGNTAANTYIWAEDLVVTSALSPEQVKSLYNAMHPAQS